MDVRAKYFSPVRAPLMRHRPTIKQLPHHKSWCTANLTTRRICRGEIFFARPCAIDAPSPNHEPSPHHKSWRTPNLTTRRICRGEIFFARARAIDAQSPTRFDRAPAVRRRMCRGEIFFARACAIDAQSPTRYDRAPAVRRRNTDVGAKYFSPARARLMRNRPHVMIACPPCAAAPWMYGRKIFRPYVRHRCPFAPPSNIATPQIVAHAKFNNAPHWYGPKIFRPYVCD